MTALRGSREQARALAGRWRSNLPNADLRWRRRAAELEAMAAESHNIFSFPGDTTDRAAMAAMVSGIEEAHGPIALAFLNAASLSSPNATDSRPALSGALSRSMSAGRSIVS